jgi:secreted effector protein SseB
MSYVDAYAGRAGTVGASAAATASSAATRSSASVSTNGDQLLSAALEVLYKLMEIMAQNGNDQFAKMNTQADVARDAQNAANEVDAVLANLIKDDATGALPDSVYQYMKDNGVLVSGQTIDEFLSGKNKQALNKGDLKAIQSALETSSGRASDFVTQSQLEIQKTTQSYSQISSMISNIQTLMKDMNGTIITAIRA